MAFFKKLRGLSIVFREVHRGDEGFVGIYLMQDSFGSLLVSDELWHDGTNLNSTLVLLAWEFKTVLVFLDLLLGIFDQAVVRFNSWNLLLVIESPTSIEGLEVEVLTISND